MREYLKLLVFELDELQRARRIHADLKRIRESIRNTMFFLHYYYGDPCPLLLKTYVRRACSELPEADLNLQIARDMVRNLLLTA